MFGYIHVVLSSIEWVDIQAMHSIIDNSWLCSTIFNWTDSALLVIHASCHTLGAIQGLVIHPYFASLVRCNPRIVQPTNPRFAQNNPWIVPFCTLCITYIYIYILLKWIIHIITDNGHNYINPFVSEGNSNYMAEWTTLMTDHHSKRTTIGKFP